MFAKMLARLKGDEAPKDKAGSRKRRVSGTGKAQAARQTGKALRETAPLLEKEGETDGVSTEDEGITLPVQPPKPTAQGSKAEL